MKGPMRKDTVFVRRTAHLVCFVALMCASGTLPAADLPACPALLDNVQSATSVPAGWTGQSFSGRQRFRRLTFKLAGDPGELGNDDERMEGGQFKLIWDVTGMKGLQQICEYSGTMATLSRPVVGAVTRCEVVLATAKPGAALISAVCK